MSWLLWIGARLLNFGGWLREGLQWITGSRARAMGAVIVVLLLALAWWQHGIAARDREIAALRLERDGWRKAGKVLRQSNERLTAALHEQNAAVEGLKADADKRVLAGQAALAQAKDRSALREGLAARIDAQRAPAGAVEDCRTTAAVMAAKGEL
jgi:type II secretory pathway component PulJ